MSKKYRVITKIETLDLFKTHDRLFRYEVINMLQTSRYKVIQILEDLMDDGLIERVKVKLEGVSLPMYYYQLKL